MRAATAQQRGERHGDQQERGPRRERPRRPRRDDGPDRAERERYYAKPHGSGGGDRRNKEPDPNSPFAKLAALKAQLEQNGKEPS